MLVTKYQTVESSSSNSTNMIPDSMEELLDQYIFVFPQTKEGQFYFEDPNSVEEAKALTINTLITSSLCSASDKNSWAFQLFKIYQQYPDWMLRDVMNKLRTNKMVSLKKQCNRSRVKTGNYLPLSSSPYQLSVTFSHVFLNRYQHEIYHQSWDFIKNVVLEYKLRPNNFKEVIVNHEGGYAASVSCLLGLQCLKFKIEVPDQLVVLDPNMSGVDDAYARILRRYKELLRNSGSKEIESDIEAQNLNVNSSSQDDTNNTMLSDEVNNKSMEVTSSKKETQKELTQCAEPLGTNNVIFNERSNVDSPNCTAEERSSQVVARSASRIALHVMKEEYKESSKSSHKEMAKNDKTIQHSHDFFVISSCRIFINSGKDIESSWIRCIWQIQYSLTFKVYNYIKSGKELGVTGTDLCIQFPDINIEAICISMIDSFLILRAGCVRTRYICIEYSSPWLLHSFKMLRTRHKEAAPNLKHSTKLFNVDPNLENKSNNEVSEAVKKVDWSKVDQIHIILRPWVKIDGNLNRRVLDRLLGAVLGYVMLKPGQYMDKIQQKFSPALQPQHTRELLDMLKELGAINVFKV
ncbi:GTF3C1 [Lepeophtheirus salmonis]|uniref:GTF3C1 n=1 Tax=Lepeophtheirus salmonis TaxID=72036 RepID=A0A7R8D1V8_LEPSM|nr:GTF3C1 [Lepeophtheirus salmonis]CAF2999673.1 GTF3C1 [Lepeophtheirus salmonis]